MESENRIPDQNRIISDDQNSAQTDDRYLPTDEDQREGESVDFTSHRSARISPPPGP